MFITINNMKLNYKVDGEGSPVILLHGWGANIQAFSPVHQHLAKHHKVYTLDLPGFGESEEPPEQWGTEDYTDFLHAFIQQLKINNPILIGHSNGGRISIFYSVKYGGVKKVILVDSAGIKPKRKLNYYLKVYTFKTLKHILSLPILKKYKEDILAKVKSKTGSTDYKNASGVMQQTMVKVVNEDLQHLMPKMNIPVLLIFGENDTATPVSDGKRMEELIPDAGLVVLKNAGHFAYLDQLHQFLVIVDKFLEKDREG
ncbi:alpha/beta fold hydrolase [Evansella cellulosilytica]|uniref:Alpha/beta hydrolase fold protein n=1 Tax=Evansella cellulosilytica (strain ATCC 21833 / DSM 2522 / FERM P-1141 / JCM 9156 / N-4) TaxID=649639 RepID=E6U1T4_EVAC2|nr:alpha/beta hydrolase [Evansella cellulosilytica]ADU31581.1 alpha/beta hydrolase fold protein [Evansella cellulosilytica DSM 2522]